MVIRPARALTEAVKQRRLGSSSGVVAEPIEEIAVERDRAPRLAVLEDDVQRPAASASASSGAIFCRASTATIMRG